MYPLFVVLDDGQYRILDGYRRLAAAFWHEVKVVAVFVGSPKLGYIP
ncbi:ParB N-terminal domain-containing protein [Agrobacterium rubi]|nr:ParB N-terminal domain-containing protein [Agrobacterium rubi]NTF24418.1 ParB N-terminal domain-containing protein [Agrobacterium rubi]